MSQWAVDSRLVRNTAHASLGTLTVVLQSLHLHVYWSREWYSVSISPPHNGQMDSTSQGSGIVGGITLSLIQDKLS